MLCSFGDKVVVGQITNSSAVSCNSPSQITSGVYTARVSLNAVDFYPRNGVFISYTSVGQIMLINPWHGPSTGGTLISVTGTNIPNIPVQCLFNEVIVPALRISSSLINCYTPDMSRHSLLDFQLSVSFGTKTILSDLYFHVDKTVVISSVYPRQVSVVPDRILSVILQGSGFVGYDDLSCKIGDVVTSATWISQNNISCTLPTLLTPGIQSVALSLNGKDYYTGPFIIAVAEMVLYSLSPTFGPQQGFTEIAVSTSGFNVNSSYLCVLGGLFSEAVVEGSENKIRCMSPPSILSAGVKHLSIFSVDSNEYSNSLPFEYIPNVNILSVFPLSGPVIGKTDVTFDLSSPSFALVISKITPVCSFGTNFIPGVLIVGSKNMFVCQSPPHVYEKAKISISLNGMDFESTSYTFDYYNNPTISDYFPKMISSNTMSLLSIKGNGFEYRAWYCKYNDFIVEAEWISSTFIRCYVQFTPGVGIVSVSANKIDWIGNFVVQSQVTLKLISLSRDVVPSVGNINLSVYGYGFPENFTSPYVLVSSVNTGTERLVNVSILSSNTLMFLTPIWSDTYDNVQVSLKLDSFTSNALELSIHPTFKILDIYPHFGISTGSTLVEIFASFLPVDGVQYSTLFVFGDGMSIEVESDRFNNSLFVSTPSRLFTEKNTTNEALIYIKASSGYISNAFQYFYLGDITFLALEPKVVLENGGQVNIYVENIPQGIPILCRFEDVVLNSLTVANNYVSCLAPPHMPGNVSIYLSPNNGSDYIEMGRLRYESLPEALIVEPSSGSIDGGTVLSIRGVNVGSFEGMIVLCRFGVLEVLSTVNLDDKVVTCVSPKVLVAEVVPLSLSVRQQFGKLVDSIDLRTEFVFYERVEVLSISPKEGPSLGGTIVTISGNGFLHTNSITVSFAVEGHPKISVSCEVLSNTTIVATVPANPLPAQPGLALVSVGNNGVDFAESSVIFYWQRSLIIQEIIPSIVLESGGVDVEVLGLGFVPTFPNVIRCRFGGELVVNALYISPTTIKCTCPASLPGNVTVEVTQNGQDYIAAGNILYIATPR